MSTRRIKNLFKRQIVGTVKYQSKGYLMKIIKRLIPGRAYHQIKNSQWGARQLIDIARLGQKIYS